MTYTEARQVAENQENSIETRLDAHAQILRSDSYGGVGSAIMTQNQSAAMANIAEALAFVIRNTTW